MLQAVTNGNIFIPNLLTVNCNKTPPAATVTFCNNFSFLLTFSEKRCYKSRRLLNDIIHSIMEKRIFGVILTLLGIGGLIYTAVEFSRGGDLKNMIIFGVLGGIFFFTGIGLIRSTKDIKKANEEIS